MKARIFLLFTAFIACQLTVAQVHITISDPETWSAQELQPYIGQTVVFDQPLVVSSNYGSSLTVSPRRLFTATNQARPSTDEYKSVVNLNATGAMMLNGAPSRPDSNPYRCGEKIHNLTAKVNSTNSLTWVSGTWVGNKRADLEAGIPDLGDYRLLICTMNLEYYLAVDFDPYSSMGPDDAAEHQKQRKKIRKALSTINADAYGLVEIQQGQAALKEIAEDLNKLLPGRNYTYIDDKTQPSGTYTKSGFVYDRNTLKPIGKMQEINTRVQNRKKMICFEEIATGERFIFSVNHFKAKSGSGSGADADQHDGQGSFNASRCEEAQAVMDQYKRYHRQMLEKDLLVMGDLNAYAKEDPIHLMVADNGMIDLHRAFHADTSYSYQFGGLAGYLDHAISNGTLYPQVTGVSGYHINSDELDAYTYDKSNDTTMFRCSDHDPVLVGLKLDSTLVFDPSPAVNSYEVFTGEADELIIRNAGSKGRAFYAIYTINGILLQQKDIDGQLVDKKEILSDIEHVTLPAVSGAYILYIYSDGNVYQRRLIVR